ncbi:hypothetical protein PAMA_015899 [Pampus argenteus]
MGNQKRTENEMMKEEVEKHCTSSEKDPVSGVPMELWKLPMETDYTSRVSYPEPDPPSRQDPVSNRLHRNILAEASDAQMLSCDPEPSAQTQNLSPTVSSLSHSEGEPAQLESKPILSKLRPHSPGSPSGFMSHKQIRDPQASSRTRKQEMEMEPDAMESKSVTDLLKAASPTITVVRCRVDPDGKESADRRGDGKEEGEGQEEMGDRKSEGEEEETAANVSGYGPFTTHMFLPEIMKRRSCSPGIMGRLSASTLRGKI